MVIWSGKTVGLDFPLVQVWIQLFFSSFILWDLVLFKFHELQCSYMHNNMPRILISNLHYYLVQNVRHLPRKRLELFIAQNIIPHISLLFYKWYNEIKCITLWKFTLLPERLGLLFRVSCPSGQQIGGWEVKQQGAHLLYLHLYKS